MRALTLWQPWASFMFAGSPPPKRIETRSWATRYRGPLVICAAKKEPSWVLQEFAADRELWDLVMRFLSGSWKYLPRGAALGVVELVDVVPTGSFVVPARRFPPYHTEELLGDYSSGRFAWLTDGARLFPDPIPCRGAHGLWMPPADVVREVERSGSTNPPPMPRRQISR